MSTEAGGQAVVRAQPVCVSFLWASFLGSADICYQFLWFPCGIIRGALASMGINATVQAETSELPGATFQIKSIVQKP
jgi:trafficking protein particle complex subunit 6